jgi:hypothetical protein
MADAVRAGMAYDRLGKNKHRWRERMESKNRGVWIIVAAIVALVGCCGLLACSTVGIGLLARLSPDCCGDWDQDTEQEDGLQTQHTTETFDVGKEPILWIDSFAGGVTVHGADVDEISVTATKKARRRSDLDRIQITMTERDGGLEIKTRNPSRVTNTSVSLEITVPADTHLEADLAAGAVVVEGLTGGLRAVSAAGAIVLNDVSGGIDAQTAAGVVSARDASGPVSLESAAGVIEYQGTPQGACHFEAAAGSIALDLPARPNVAVDLQATIGAVDAACDVEGTSTGRKLKGVIGTGTEGTVRARATVGDIDLICR